MPHRTHSKIYRSLLYQQRLYVATERDCYQIGRRVKNFRRSGAVLFYYCMLLCWSESILAYRKKNGRTFDYCMLGKK
jgi:hypothetical protein